MTTLFLGHTTLDIVDSDGKEQLIPGGGVFYGAHAMLSLGSTCHVVSSCAPADMGRFSSLGEHERCTFTTLPSSNTTVCRNIYIDGDASKRQSLMHTQAAPFNVSDIDELIAANEKEEHPLAVIVTPICQEVPEDLLKRARDLGDVVALDVQGFVRHLEDESDEGISAGRPIIRSDWRNKTECLKYVDILKVDDREALLLTGIEKFEDAIQELLEMGPSVIVGTHTDGLVVANAEGEVSHAQWIPGWNIEGRTGRGDTCLASFVFAHVIQQRNLDDSTKFAVDITSMKMKCAGPVSQTAISQLLFLFLEEGEDRLHMHTHTDIDNDNIVEDITLGCVRKLGEDEDREKVFAFSFDGSDGLPSKVGGHPVWLDPYNVPDVIKCKHCDTVMSFVLQIYAPLDGIEAAYHRVMYLFFCRQEGCGKDFRVVRMQQTEAEAEINGVNGKEKCTLCHVCGQKADMVCAQCKRVSYCSKQHQKLDWKGEQGHKMSCTGLSDEVKVKVNPRHARAVWPEYEIVTEDEPEATEDEIAHVEKANSDQAHAAELLKKYRDGERNGEDHSMSEAEQKEIEQLMIPQDAVFLSFQERVSRLQDQIIRYQHDFQRQHCEPLWPCDRGSKPPRPAVPQSPRSFEFQVMPQLLFYLGVGALGKESTVDWGSLVVYSCVASCSASHEEYVWKEDME